MPQKPQQNKLLLDIEDILRILPHRYPFLLVDRILELKKGKSIVAIKNVTINEPFFQGHFPQFRVMPGVLLLESLAQAAGVLIYSSLPDPEKKLLFISKIDAAKFRRQVVPGDQLRIEVDVVRLRQRFGHVKGKGYVDGQVAVECEALASLVDLEDVNGQK